MNYQTQSIRWRDIPIKLRYHPQYFASAPMAQIVICCEEKLPVTSTGYQSLFIHQDIIPDIHAAVDYMISYLDKEATATDWQREAQFSLFA